MIYHGQVLLFPFALILGPSSLAALPVMAILIPINGLIARKLRQMQVTQLEFKDKRIKLTNEILNGMSVSLLFLT